jgi:transcriptional regulator CtsR
VDRVYLTLGMGNSYNVSPGVGTVGWVDKATIGTVTYNFVVATTILVENMQPDWTSAGGGGVFSAYIGPPAYGYVSPGTTAIYDGREAGIIKAGLAVDPTSGIYEDEGLLAFKVNVDIASFASQVLSYDVQNETGANPVWVRIRLVGGTQYQFVPTTNPAGWHTVDAAAGQWQLMDGNGNATGLMMTLAQVATANPGATVDRVYLTLGMGNSYNVSPGVGTVGWVDKVKLGKVTYDFVVATSPDKDITSFSFPEGAGTIIGTAIAVTVPYDTNVTALVATFTTTGASVKVGTTVQTSGTTANNFTSPVTYTVTAADASTQDYTVTVTVAANPAKAITAFGFPEGAGTIIGTAIAVTVPYDTNVTALVATFTTTGASVKVGTAVQVSGTTANNFTSPVTYTVTAADASTQAYTVTVTVAANSAKDITAFSFPQGAGVITGTNIAVTVPFGTSRTALVATFTTTGSSVKVGTAVQVSGTTANNFTSPVTYTVTAADASTQAYTVTVTVGAAPLSSDKAITAFNFNALSPAVSGVVNESAKTVALTVPFGTNVTALVPTITITGASINPASGAANNFTTPQTYTVTAANSSTQAYVVTVTIALPAINIVVTSPNGGETWAVGSIHNITWTSSGVTGNVNIQLSRNGGTTYTTIVANTPTAAGTKVWTVTAPVTATARIKVASVANAALSDTSNADFAIAALPAVPVLKSPLNAATKQSLTPVLEWNASATAVTYGVQVSTNSSFTNPAPLINQSGLGTSYPVPALNLNWNTTYHWRANATNSAGTSAWSTTRTFRTNTGPTPSAFISLNAAAASSTQINLTWTGASGDETGFKIERKTGAGTFTQIATVAGAGVTSYNNTGLLAGTTYTYRVRAYNGAGNSDYSDTASATTWIAAPSAPVLVSPPSGAVNSPLTPTLTWNASTRAATYGLQVSTHSSFSGPTPIVVLQNELADAGPVGIIPVNVSGLTDTHYDVIGGLSFNTTYYWRVNATNGTGTSAWSAVRTFKTAVSLPPNVPIGLGATAVSPTRINLAWTDNSTGETGFKIERKTGAGAFALIANVGANVTSYNNTTGLVANTAYTYRVRAYKGSLYSDYSATASDTTWIAVPKAPLLLSPASGAVNPTTLTWNASTGALTYKVQVSTVSNFATTVIDTSSGADTHYDFSGLAVNKYYWRVSATNGSGTSAWSSTRNFTIR